jgi:hypothetical protein
MQYGLSRNPVSTARELPLARHATTRRTNSSVCHSLSFLEPIGNGIEVRALLNPLVLAAQRSPGSLEIIEFLVGAITRTREPKGVPESLLVGPARNTANQFCLFFKPWCTERGVNVFALLELFLRAIEVHELTIDEVAVLPGLCLHQHRTMHAHYWRMTQLAEAAVQYLPLPAYEVFHATFNARIEEQVVLGGFEFLEHFKAFTPHTLEILWENVEQFRLGNSISCARIVVGNKSVFLVNGFVPNLLETYYSSDSVVVAFSLRGELSWSDARKRFVGQTDPAKAAFGSLRNTLYVHREKLGIVNLRLGANGVHLSSGPIEALLELQRLMSLTYPHRTRAYTGFQFGRRLHAVFSPDEVSAIAANPMVIIDGRNQTVFDLTEECDEESAVALLLRIRDQLPPTGYWSTGQTCRIGVT